jgi:beta-glucuronidase
VFLNGAFLGSHRGASTAFVVEITGRLRPGANVLLLCVNNDRRPDRARMQNTDWFNYGGPHRDVEVFATPAAVIRDLFVRPVPMGASTRSPSARSWRARAVPPSCAFRASGSSIC